MKTRLRKTIYTECGVRTKNEVDRKGKLSELLLVEGQILRKMKMVIGVWDKLSA